jgi:hypothetical protein
MVLLNPEQSRIILPGLLSIYINVTIPKKGEVILKLDFEKAFDKVEHSLILAAL